MRPAKAGTTACWSQQHPQLQFVKGDRREEQAAVPRQSAPCATPTQGWYQSDPSEEISRPGQLPVVRQGELKILHVGHGQQIDSNTWAGRPRSVMNTGPWLAARLAEGGFRRWPRAFQVRRGVGVAGCHRHAEWLSGSPRWAPQAGQPIPSCSTDVVELGADHAALSGSGNGKPGSPVWSAPAGR